MMSSPETKIVLASGNLGKIKEIQAILTDYQLETQNSYAVPEAEETGTTFVENAIIKARNAAQHTGIAAIADDSGLVVDGLQGAPGVISARYASVGASDADNLQKLLVECAKIPEQQRTARFICVMVFMRYANDPTPLIAQGSWEGLITLQASGDNGFGYDPVFWLTDYQCTSAELSPELKNQLSHRGQALQHLTTLMENKKPNV